MREHSGNIQETFREHSEATPPASPPPNIAQATGTAETFLLLTKRVHSGNIQGTFRGTFREHSGNIQGIFRENSGNIPGTFRGDSTSVTPSEHSAGNWYSRDFPPPDKTCAFREHSGNISGNIQGTFREHSGNIQGTFRKYSGNIQR
jgi:hypothetical protein